VLTTKDAVIVRWESNGHTNVYRAGVGGMFDVRIVSGLDAAGDRTTDSAWRHPTSLTTRRTSATSENDATRDAAQRSDSDSNSYKMTSTTCTSAVTEATSAHSQFDGGGTDTSISAENCVSTSTSSSTNIREPFSLPSGLFLAIRNFNFGILTTNPNPNPQNLIGPEVVVSCLPAGYQVYCDNRSNFQTFDTSGGWGRGTALLRLRDPLPSGSHVCCEWNLASIDGQTADLMLTYGGVDSGGVATPSSLVDPRTCLSAAVETPVVSLLSAPSAPLDQLVRARITLVEPRRDKGQDKVFGINSLYRWPVVATVSADPSTSIAGGFSLLNN